MSTFFSSFAPSSHQAQSDKLKVDLKKAKKGKHRGDAKDMKRRKRKWTPEMYLSQPQTYLFMYLAKSVDNLIIILAVAGCRKRSLILKP
jgi:hypothetical protein